MNETNLNPYSRFFDRLEDLLHIEFGDSWSYQFKDDDDFMEMLLQVWTEDK